MMASLLIIRRLSSHTTVYDHKLVEQRWRQILSSPSDNIPSSNSCSYILPMFPYPSGALHMGHVRVYTISDTIAQYQRMKGCNVLHPIGWDSFGLPAENAAIERGHLPSVWTDNNIQQMKDQLLSLGIQFNWDKELSTSSPLYYKWTQWLFLQLYNKGLAYRKEGVVNWDPIDCTVLANEQVDNNGMSWRSGAKVEERVLEQWYLKITDYAEELLKGLNELDWPERVKNDQRKWIGRSDGINIKFPIKGESTEYIEVFTTAPEHIFGVTFIALSSSHSLSGKEDIEVIHPLTGDTLPVHVTDYVIQDYGTGAVMGVPGHNDLDHQFAVNNNIPIHNVVSEHETLLDSNEFTGMRECEGRQAISEHLQSLGYGDYHVCYRLKDWCISRQRYWGTPIPVIYCSNCGIVPDEMLPVLLPSSVQLSGRGLSPLLQAAEWLNISCNKCGGNATRETDTMDTFVDSSWYYLRFIDPFNEQQLITRQQSNQWMPVNVYIGGIEHAILHLLYARFINYFLHDIGLVNNKEPFTKLLTQGMVLGRTYVNSVTGEFVKCNELKGNEIMSWQKMSKSKYNGVDPIQVINEYGADTVRLYVLFKGPPEVDIHWDTKAIIGVSNWLKRVWKMVGDHINNITVSDSSQQHHDVLLVATNRAIEEVTASFEKRYTFNVAIAELMKLSNVMKKCAPHLEGSVVYHNSLLILLKLLSPMAPHITSQLWEDLTDTSNLLNVKHDQSIMKENWPDPLIKDKSMNIIIQVNGRTVKVLSNDKPLTNEEQVINLLKEENIMTNEIVKLYIARDGKFVNVVTSS